MERLKRTALVLCALMGCQGSDSDQHRDGSSASAPHENGLSYTFTAARRSSEPSACGAYMLALQLVFEDELHKVTAIISDQTWPCTVGEDASSYELTCTTPRTDAAAVDATLSIVLFEPAPKAQIAGEATLIIRTETGSCEHAYALDGQLDG